MWLKLNTALRQLLPSAVLTATVLPPALPKTKRRPPHTTDLAADICRSVSLAGMAVHAIESACSRWMFTLMVYLRLYFAELL